MVKRYVFTPDEDIKKELRRRRTITGRPMSKQINTLLREIIRRKKR